MPKNSEYKTKLQYQQSQEVIQNKRKRKRSIIWLNLPYRKFLKTNIGKIFNILILIQHININKHFPQNRKFVKNFKKNLIKFSYS